MRTLNKIALWVLLLLLRASVSWADFHEVKIDEVMAGLNGDATVQFIELQLIGTDQKCQGTGNIIDFTNHLCDGSGPGAKLVFFNAQGSQTAEFIFPGNTPLGDAGRSILIATQQFANLAATPTPDFIMPANVVPNNGKVCYRNRDSAPFSVNACLAYGNFTGNPESTGIAPVLPIDGAQSLRRVSDSFSNAIDFTLGAPAPRNNAGNCGTVTGGNSCPVAVSQNVTTLEDTPVNITLTGFDAEGSPLVFSIVSSPSRGFLSGTLPNLIYTPFTNSNGLDSFTFKVNDGTFDSNTATVSINITAVNDPPIANIQFASTVVNTPVNIFLSSFDPEGDFVSFSMLTAPTNGTLSGNPPNVVYTPHPGFVGSDGFTFKVNDGLLDSNPATVSINVRTNIPPVVFGQSVTVVSGMPRNINLNGFDPDGQPISFSIVTFPVNGSLTGTPPAVVYTANPGFIGSDSFTFMANDGQANSGPATVSISVSPPCVPTPITFGESRSGSLSNTDCFAPHRPGSFADLYTFSGIAGLRINIRMDFSTAFTSFLILTDPLGNTLAQSSSCLGISLSSCIPFDAVTVGKITLPSNGTYTIEATSTFSGAIGDYTLTLTEDPTSHPLAIDAPSLPEGEVNVSYTGNLGLNGGVPPYTFQFLKGSLPAGLTLDSQGVITGVPTSNKKANFTLQVKDQNNVTTSKSFSIVLFKVLSIASNSLKAAKVGIAYSTTLKGKGGKLPFSWLVQPDSFPAWLNFDPATGVLSGTPPGPGTFPITFQLTDAMGGQAQKTLNLVVK